MRAFLVSRFRPCIRLVRLSFAASLCISYSFQIKSLSTSLPRLLPAESTQRELAAIADWQTQGDDAVQALKKEFDTAWTPSWHVVIGKNFGSRVTHEARRQTFFYLGDKAVLIFKA